MTGMAAQNAGHIEESDGNILLLCLDKSGSMAGSAFKALLEGAETVGKSVYADKKFKTFACYFFDNRGQAEERGDFERYKQMLAGKKAGGGTNFVCVFDFIEKYVKNKKKYNTKNLTVIFFTDGCDTSNKPEKIDSSLEKLKNCVQAQ